jgi:hypothetical protein
VTATAIAISEGRLHSGEVAVEAESLEWLRALGGVRRFHDGCMFGLEIPTRVPGSAEELELIAPNQRLPSAELGIAQRRITEGKNS